MLNGKDDEKGAGHYEAVVQIGRKAEQEEK